MAFNKKMLTRVILPILLIAGFFIYGNSYSEFPPTAFDGKSFKLIKVDQTFYKNLADVLEIYNEAYKIDKGGKILIKRSLKSDEELIWNYTSKALETTWLNERTKAHPMPTTKDSL